MSDTNEQGCPNTTTYDSYAYFNQTSDYEGGNLPDILRQLADKYEEEMEGRTGNITKVDVRSHKTRYGWHTVRVVGRRIMTRTLSPKTLEYREENPGWCYE